MSAQKSPPVALAVRVMWVREPSPTHQRAHPSVGGRLPSQRTHITLLAAMWTSARRETGWTPLHVSDVKPTGYHPARTRSYSVDATLTTQQPRLAATHAHARHRGSGASYWAK